MGSQMSRSRSGPDLMTLAIPFSMAVVEPDWWNWKGFLRPTSSALSSSLYFNYFNPPPNYIST